MGVWHGSHRVVRLHTCWLRAAPPSVPANQVEACMAFYHLVSDVRWCPICHTLLIGAVRSPPRFGRRGCRPYLSMRRREKGPWPCLNTCRICFVGSGPESSSPGPSSRQGMLFRPAAFHSISMPVIPKCISLDQTFPQAPGS